MNVGKLFVSVKLHRHLRTHTNEKIYEYIECGKCFMLFSYLSHHWRILTGIKFHHCNKCEIAFSQRNYLVQHQIHSMQKAYECNKHVCAWEDSVIFHPLFSVKESVPRRSHSSVAKVTNLSVGVQVFFIIRISTPDQNLIQCKWKKCTSTFQALLNIKILERNFYIKLLALIFSLQKKIVQFDSKLWFELASVLKAAFTCSLSLQFLAPTILKKNELNEIVVKINEIMPVYSKT
ncbi:hypothetical protein GH733_017947, partial [Mirounga leonina]